MQYMHAARIITCMKWLHGERSLATRPGVTQGKIVQRERDRQRERDNERGSESQCNNTGIMGVIVTVKINGVERRLSEAADHDDTCTEMK